MSVADFEVLVLGQQPAAKDWAPVTDYSVEARKAIEGPHPQLILDVFQPTRILDVGCGFNYLVTFLNQAAGYRIAYGADLSNPAADIRFDITAPGGVAWSPTELVICREVLEHLTVRQLRRAVTNLCAISSRWVYGTTRFSSEHDILRVETQDGLDPTHITIPAKDFLKVLFVLEGFRWRQDLADQMDWKGYGRTFVFERVA